ncbi:MAG TPA: hypothetical protein VGB53_13610, partial [Rubricoccaceae bacterium]
STDALTQDTTTLFTGLRDEPDLLADLADYKIELDDEVATGLALLQALRDAIGDQFVESGEAKKATETAGALLAALKVLYVRHRKLARGLHTRGTAGYAALRLAGDIPEDTDGLLGDIDAFYTALQQDPSLYDDIRGISKTTVEDARARVDAARLAETAQARESGESQEATITRETVEASLRALAQDVATAVEDAFHDQPQRRERLGLFQRGSH